MVGDKDGISILVVAEDTLKIVDFNYAYTKILKYIIHIEIIGRNCMVFLVFFWFFAFAKVFKSVYSIHW